LRGRIVRLKESLKDTKGKLNGIERLSIGNLKEIIALSRMPSLNCCGKRKKKLKLVKRQNWLLSKSQNASLKNNNDKMKRKKKLRLKSVKTVQ